MARIRNGAIDATMTLPGVARRPGRPVTGKAKTAAQRMREYRQRRHGQANEFPSRVTEISPYLPFCRHTLILHIRYRRSIPIPASRMNLYISDCFNDLGGMAGVW